MVKAVVNFRFGRAVVKSVVRTVVNSEEKLNKERALRSEQGMSISLPSFP